MASRDQVLKLVDSGLSYEEIAVRLDISSGLAYLIATGMPADGSDAPSAHAHDRRGFLRSSQHLSNPQPADNPTSSESVHEWIRSRVTADRQMRRAAAARDAEPGSKDEAGTGDLVDVLTRDHNQVNALLKQLATIPGKVKGGSPDQMSARKSITDLITGALSRHEAAEEQVLWPAVRNALPDGDARADTALNQEREGNDVLTALGRLDGEQEEFDELVEKLSAAARKHVAFEERVFLDLRERLPREELVRLGKDLVRVRDAAPKQRRTGRD